MAGPSSDIQPSVITQEEYESDVSSGAPRKKLRHEVDAPPPPHPIHRGPRGIPANLLPTGPPPVVNQPSIRGPPGKDAKVAVSTYPSAVLPIDKALRRARNREQHDYYYYEQLEAEEAEEEAEEIRRALRLASSAGSPTQPTQAFGPLSPREQAERAWRREGPTPRLSVPSRSSSPSQSRPPQQPPQSSRRPQLRVSSSSQAPTFTSYERVLPGPEEPVVVPIEELALPGEHHGRVPPLTIRLRFDGPFKESEDQNDAIATILCYLNDHLNGWSPEEQPLVSFPQPHGQVTHVDVTFATVAHFKRAQDVDIIFNGFRLRIDFVGSALPRSYICIVVKHVPVGGDLRNLASVFADRLARWGCVKEVWAPFCTVQGLAPAFKGELICLFDRGSTLLMDVPGWVRVEATHHRLSYNGRYDHCYWCQADAVKFHTFSACTRRPSAAGQPSPDVTMV